MITSKPLTYGFLCSQMKPQKMMFNILNRQFFFWNNVMNAHNQYSLRSTKVANCLANGFTFEKICSLIENVPVLFSSHWKISSF